MRWKPLVIYTTEDEKTRKKTKRKKEREEKLTQKIIITMIKLFFLIMQLLSSSLIIFLFLCNKIKFINDDEYVCLSNFHDLRDEDTTNSESDNLTSFHHYKASWEIWVRWWSQNSPSCRHNMIIISLMEIHFYVEKFSELWEREREEKESRVFLRSSPVRWLSLQGKRRRWKWWWWKWRICIATRISFSTFSLILFTFSCSFPNSWWDRN